MKSCFNICLNSAQGKPWKQLRSRSKAPASWPPASTHSVGTRLPGQTGDPGNRRLVLQKARPQPSPTSVCQQTQANKKGHHWPNGGGGIRASKPSNNE